MSVQQEFLGEQSLCVQSIWLKSMCKKSFWVKSMCKNSTFEESLGETYRGEKYG